MKYLLGIDLGGGSTKLTLIDENGELFGEASQEYPTYYPRPGWSEQDPGDWLVAVGDAVRELIDKTGINPRDIVCVTPDAATHTAVLLDEHCKVIRKSIFWTDKRSMVEVNELKEQYGNLIFDRTQNTPTEVWTLPQLIWLRKNESETFLKIRHILFEKDYVRFRMTGILQTDNIEAMGSMLYDVKQNDWSDELLNLVPLSKDALPPIVSATDSAGIVTKEGEEIFGLAEGTRVFNGTTDTVMEQLAVGNIAMGDIGIKLATAGRICAITNGPVISPYTFNYRHVVDGLWYPGTATSSCAASLRWFRDGLGGQPFEELLKEAAEVKTGSEGIIFHPYLQGELTPYNDATLRASFVGISSHHTRGHFARAVLEGVAFSMKDCGNVINELGLNTGRIRLLGGGSSSSLWAQIVSDVFGKPMEKTERDDSSLGSAILAGVASGIFGSFEEGVKKCVHVTTRYEPNFECHKKYTELFIRYKKVQSLLEEYYHEN